MPTAYSITAMLSFWIILNGSNGRATAESNQVFDRQFYPDFMPCGPITSRFGSMTDLDGSNREAPHTGIDFGDFGDTVIAPADGYVGAIWPVKHAWGTDWNLLLVHTAGQLNFSNRQVVFYAEFNHLQRGDFANLKTGDHVNRGSPIGIVRHPGSNKHFRAETHLEIYEIPIDRLPDTEWRDEAGFKYWYNPSARLVDPMTLLGGRNLNPGKKAAKITLFDPRRDYTEFKGFVYPLLCAGK